MKQDRLYLIHIGECIERIERYVAPGYAAFQKDTLIQDAVLRNLHTLTESTQRISDSLKMAHPKVAWREIAQFRNVVVHNYLGVDLARVWDIVQHDLPELKYAITAMLAELEVE
ncbi:MAG: DUF86 domain-containing protein [Anaerolineae bacterium]|nr:DUF86 domain-containing protein [Anaerolineae bacterium]